MSDINNIDFMFEIAFNKRLPSFYKSIFLLNNNGFLLSNKQLKTLEIDSDIYTVYDVPSHFKISQNEMPAAIRVKKIIQHKGFYIDLNGYQNTESYLKDQFSRSTLQALRSGKKRLETCFNISYKMYFGSIDKSDYNFLFKSFYEMLKLRANEKGIKNRNLQHWDLYTKKVYEMILKKEASLFVIYDGEKPINISLNIHLKDIVFLFITTYNIDYFKFRIGHTNWAWLIDWFLKNNVKFIDFSKGNTAYKKRWTNREYNFEYHLFYDSTKVLTKLKVSVLEKKLQLLQFLRNKNINDYFYTTSNKLKKTKAYIHQKKHKFIEVDLLPNKNELSEIHIQQENQFGFLRPIIYQYLYLKSTNIKDVNIYSSTKKENEFFIKNKNKFLKLLVEN